MEERVRPDPLRERKGEPLNPDANKPPAEEEAAPVLDIRVRTRAQRDALGPLRNGRLLVSVTAPPERGKANQAVVALLAARLSVPKSGISIVKGASSRTKSVRIEGADPAALADLFGKP